MRSVISQFMSLDGVVQAPGWAEEDTDGGFFAHGGWSIPYFDPDVMGGFMGEAMQGTEALLFGRRTWQTMAAAGPDRDDGKDPFAMTMNEIAKPVVSSTLTQDDLHWNSSMLLPGADAAASVTGLNEQHEGVVGMMGSSQLSRTLIEAGLVDEYRLLIEPVMLGGGKSLFPADGEKRPLELVGTTIAGGGVLCCVYRPGETPPMPSWEG